MYKYALYTIPFIIHSYLSSSRQVKKVASPNRTGNLYKYSKSINTHLRKHLHKDSYEDPRS